MSSTLINTEALESAIYNPTVDKKALMLQELMEKSTAPTGKTYPAGYPLMVASSIPTYSTAIPLAAHDYINTFTSMPVYNPYQGVLANPIQCLIDDIRDIIRNEIGYVKLESQPLPGNLTSPAVPVSILPGTPPVGSLFHDIDTYHPDDYAWQQVRLEIEMAIAGKNPVYPVYNYEPGNSSYPVMDPSYYGWTTGIDPATGQPWVDGGEDDYTYCDYVVDEHGVEGALDCIEDHTDRLTSNLPSLTGIAQAAMALDTIMNLLSNPCLGLSGFLGSIMDKGKALIKSATEKLKGMVDKAKGWIRDNVAPVIDGITGAISGITDAIAEVTGKVKEMMAKAREEVAKFAKAMLASARQGLAELMANLPNDPCLKGLLGSVATGAAAAVLGG